MIRGLQDIGDGSDASFTLRARSSYALGMLTTFGMLPPVWSVAPGHSTSAVSSITPARARNLLAGVRGTLGTMALVAPRLTARIFGIDVDAQPSAVYLARLFGIRDVLMSHQLVSARTDEEAEEALRGGLCVDAVDTVSALAGLARGDLSVRTAFMGAAAAGGALALGVMARGDSDAAERT